MADEVVTTNNEYLELKPVKHKKHISRKSSELIFVFLMLLFPIIQFVLFWVVPNISSILMAFQLNDNVSDVYTLNNFVDFFKAFKSYDDYGRPAEIVYAIINSLIYFAVNIFICTPIVIFFSYVLFRKVPFSGAFRVIFYLPSIIGTTVMATLFKSLTSEGGSIYQLLYQLGFIDKKIEYATLYQITSPGYEHLGFVMILIYSIWTCVGINMILFHGAMKRIPQEIFESADIDGVGFFRQFFDIVIPLIWPTVATMIIFSLSSIFVSYTTNMLLTPGNEFATTIGYYIFGRVNNQEFVYPAAVGLIFTAIGLPFVLLVRWGLNKIGSDIEY